MASLARASLGPLSRHGGARIVLRVARGRGRAGAASRPPGVPPNLFPVPRRVLLSLLAATALALPGALVPTAGHADGDPASDVLLGENVFYPYTPPVSASLQQNLNAETAAAAKARFPVKVALIASPVDLGVVPSLFGKPQQYAKFLDQEISYLTSQPLLVVMAAGYGVQGMTASAQSAAASLPKPAGTSSDELAQAAVSAVRKLAAASGHPLPGSAAPGGSSSSGGSSSTLIIVVVLVLVAAGAAAAVVMTRRRRPRRIRARAGR